MYMKHTHIYTNMFSFTHQNISMRLKDNKDKMFSIVEELEP